MAQYDPLEKIETWVFRDVGRQLGEPVYQRMKFNIVYFDNVQMGYIEPVNFAGELKDGVDQVDLLDPARNSIERPRIKAKFEFLNSNPFFELHQFD